MSDDIEVHVKLFAIAASHMNPHEWRQYHHEIVALAEGKDPILHLSAIRKSKNLINDIERTVNEQNPSSPSILAPSTAG